MNNETAYQRFAALINKHTSFSICLPLNPTVDSVASAVALYVVFTKLGKNVNIACASVIPPHFATITGIDKIQKNIATGGNNLVVSFPYNDGSIDKVTYNIEGNYFNLVIQPREGFNKINPGQVRYTYSGGKVDVIIVIDAPTLNSLGELYTANQDHFKGRDIVNIDRHLTNANFGTLNIVEKKIASTSEIVLRIINYLNSPIDRDIATNLYTGIMAATNNFSSYSVTPETFEASAYLLKSGAVKKSNVRPINNQGAVPAVGFTPQPSRQPIDQSQNIPSPTFDDFGENYDDASFGAPATSVNNQQFIQQERPANQQQPIRQQGQRRQMKENALMPEDKVEARENKAEEASETNQKPAPKEWLKPKIFRGSNLV